MKILKNNVISVFLFTVLGICFPVCIQAYIPGMVEPLWLDSPLLSIGLAHTNHISKDRRFLADYNENHQDRNKNKSTHDQEPQPLKKIGNNGILINAKKEALIGNVTGALEIFRRYIDRYPSDPVGYFEAGRLEATQKNYSEAIALTKHAVALDPGNIWFTLFLAELYQMAGNITDAVSIYEKIVAENPGNLDYFYQLAALYLQVEKYNDAIRIYNKIEENAGVSEDISLQKEKIYLHQNDLKDAENELKKLITAFPGESRYYSILAEFYMSNSMPDKALEIYKQISVIDPDNAYIHMSMADYYRKTGNKLKAFEELKLGFANPNLDVDAKINIMLSFYTVNQIYNDLRGEAFTLAEILINTHPKDPRVYSIYGDLLTQDQKFPEARETFLKALTLDSSRYAIWEQILRLDIQLGFYEHLLTYSQRANELFPEQPLPFLFAGIGYMQLKQNAEALVPLLAGAKLVVDNNDLLAQFYMYQGDALHALNRETESFTAYERSLQAKEDNAYVLNNYAYYLSLEGKELDKAEKMAKKAVTLEPENASFQDTYGWVLYKQGKFDNAREWVSKALQNKEETSAEVLEHYGDILYQLGDKALALDYWMQAKKKGKGSEWLDKKIAEKKLVE
ncbi:MAG: tetratricopeptide repeat protein [Bacteroidales bacterium]|jgi:tetratricopeptide (TPR) repeat protein|nr:tetratricopeptide repeat protein [Bacteroidales bacterium]